MVAYSFFAVSLIVIVDTYWENIVKPLFSFFRGFSWRGLGALLAASATAYDIVKWCGALYLLWLGIQLILHPRQSFSTTQGDILCLFPAAVYSCRTAADSPDISARHYSCGYRYALVIDSDYDDRLRLTPAEITALYPVDGSPDRRTFYVFAVKLALSHR